MFPGLALGNTIAFVATTRFGFGTMKLLRFQSVESPNFDHKIYRLRNSVTSKQHGLNNRKPKVQLTTEVSTVLRQTVFNVGFAAVIKHMEHRLG